MTKADLQALMQRDGLPDAWRITLENESEPREELYTLEKASGLLVKGGWKVKIVHAKDFDKGKYVWINFESPQEPISPVKETIPVKPRPRMWPWLAAAFGLVAVAWGFWGTGQKYGVRIAKLNAAVPRTETVVNISKHDDKSATIGKASLIDQEPKDAPALLDLSSKNPQQSAVNPDVKTDQAAPNNSEKYIDDMNSLKSALEEVQGCLNDIGALLTTCVWSRKGNFA
jgi:hypothetical protein